MAVNLRWKTWEFFTKFVYYTGHSLRNDVTPLYSTYGSLQSTSTYGSINGAMHKDMVNRWTESNKDTDIPAMRSATLRIQTGKIYGVCGFSRAQCFIYQVS